jgi:hypothetical protein
MIWLTPENKYRIDIRAFASTIGPRCIRWGSRAVDPESVSSSRPALCGDQLSQAIPRDLDTDADRADGA